METVSELPLPPIQAVLDRLKSDGTFDQFRKVCLATIEEEPSYRAQKEHVEILSRRFLNDNETKEMTKNEVRSKLRLYVLDELKKPGVQASHTIEELVENTLESKSAELFKNILDVVNTLLHPPTPPPTDIIQDIKFIEHQGCLASAPAPPKTSTTTSSFELPIDLLTLPGLSNSNKAKQEGGQTGNKKVTKLINNKSSLETISNSNELKRKINEGGKKREQQQSIGKDNLKKAKAVTKLAVSKVTKQEKKVSAANVSIKKEEESIVAFEKGNKREGKEREDGKAKEKEERKKEEKWEEKKRQENEDTEDSEIEKENTKAICENLAETREIKKEEEEDVFDDASTVSCLPSRPSGNKKVLRRSARLASHGSADKSREGTPTEDYSKKRALNSEEEKEEEEEGNVHKKRKITDLVNRDSTSSEEKPEEENVLEKRGRRSIRKRVPTRRLSSMTSISPPPLGKSSAKSVKRVSPAIVTRSNRLVKRSNRYYPGEEITESEDDKETVEEEKEEERIEEERVSKRKARRV